MTLEVALLERTDGSGAIRLLGRSSDPGLIEAVREHLMDRLGDDRPRSAPLQLVRPEHSGQSDAEGPEDKT